MSFSGKFMNSFEECFLILGSQEQILQTGLSSQSCYTELENCIGIYSEFFSQVQCSLGLSTARNAAAFPEHVSHCTWLHFVYRLRTWDIGRTCLAFFFFFLWTFFSCFCQAINKQQPPLSCCPTTRQLFDFFLVFIDVQETKDALMTFLERGNSFGLHLGLPLKIQQLNSFHIIFFIYYEHFWWPFQEGWFN